MVALAFLMPIVASMGGNAGMQTLAVTIRAIATKELSSGNFNKVVGKEFFIGILNGIIFAIITALIVQLWFKEINLSILIAISMVLNMIVAGFIWHIGSCYFKKIKYRSCSSIKCFCNNYNRRNRFFIFFRNRFIFFFKLKVVNKSCFI